VAPNMIRKPFGVGTERLFCSLISGRGREHLTLPLKLPEGNLWLLRCQADAVSPSNEESWGDGQAAYPPGVMGMERGEEKGTGGHDPWIRTGIGV